MNRLTISLQSQTQTGVRYTPHLTRFYATLQPADLMPFIYESLIDLGVQCRVAPPREGQEGQIRIRVGGSDGRKERFKGWVTLDRFTYRGAHGSFCVMQRDIVRLCGPPPFADS